MSVDEHPRVFFPAEGDDDLNIAYGFLFIAYGAPWIAATREDAQAGMPAIPTPLDPLLLEGLPKTEQGEQPDLAYKGRISRH
jgi:hypothetical protein